MNPSIETLPTEVACAITQAICDTHSVLALSLTCRRWHDIVRDPSIWTRRLRQDGWDDQAIIRHAGEGERWETLVRAAATREMIQDALDNLSAGTGAKLLSTKYFWERMYVVTSQIDSNHVFFRFALDAIIAEGEDPIKEFCHLGSSLDKYHVTMVIARLSYYDITESQHDFDRSKASAWYYSVTSLGESIPKFGFEYRWASVSWRLLLNTPDYDPHYFLALALLLYAQLISAVAYNRTQPHAVLPTRKITSSAYDLGDLDPHSWLVRNGQAWLSQPNLELAGYSSDTDDPDRPSTLWAETFPEIPMKMTLQRSTSTEGVLCGEGSGADGSFTVSGHLDGCLSVLAVRSLAKTWTYRGVFLPWALVGYWWDVEDEDDDTPGGEFCLWAVDRMS